jgi:tetratricopeptide (TPR) repeat protein
MADDNARSPHEPRRPETSTRRRREQSQLDFELDLFSRILDRDPCFEDVLRAHAGNLASRGLYARALQYDRRLVRLQPERPIPWYNLACSYSLLGMIEPGLTALQKAIELGYPEIDRALRDPDLIALRRDSRFARVIRRSE